MLLIFDSLSVEYNLKNIDSLTEEESLIIVSFVSIIPLFLYLIKDWLFRGRGIGKFMLGLRTVNSNTLKPCGFFQSILRNIWVPLLLFSLSIIYTNEEQLPLFLTNFSILYGSYLLLSIVAVIADIKGRKLSDFISGTRVVENRDLKIRQLI